MRHQYRKWMIFFLLSISYIFGIMMDGGTNLVNSEPIENIEADLVWSEVETEDYEIYFSSLRNGQWSPKTKLSNHRAMDLLPSVGSGIDGTIWVVWFAAQGSISDLYYSVFDGENWSIPEMISTGFSSNTAPFVVVDNNNVPWIVWAGFDGEDDDIYFTRWNGFGWDSPSMVNMDNTTPDIIPVIKIGQNNLPWVKWSGYDGNESKNYFSRWTGSKWSEELIEDIENINQSLMGISEHLISDLPEFVGSQKLATIHVKSNGEGSTFRIREAMEESEDDNNLDILQKQTEIQSDEKTIIGYGDSITQGIPYVAEAGAGRRIGGYEPDLEAITQGFGWNTEVLNYGFGGESTASGLSRLGNQTLGKHNAKYVLILEGTNDLIYYGISVDSTIYYLGQMIDKSRAFNVTPVIATLTPDTKSPKNNIPTDYNPRIKDLALRKNCALADQYAATISNWSSLTDDGLHPNRAGYKVMAQAWYDALPETPELTVVTIGASEIDETSVVMNGRINLKGYSTNYFFEFGETPDLGSQTNTENAGDSIGEVSVSISVDNFSDDSIYYYRLVAQNDFVKKEANIVSFQTLKSPSSKKSCFIATAAFGSSLEPHVVALKAFRDRYLITNTLGKKFVNFYYKKSPVAAKFIKNHNALKVMVRAFLYPVTWYVQFIVNTSSWMKLFLGSAFVILFPGLGWVYLHNIIRCKNNKDTNFVRIS